MRFITNIYSLVGIIQHLLVMMVYCSLTRANGAVGREFKSQQGVDLRRTDNVQWGRPDSEEFSSRSNPQHWGPCNSELQ